MYEKWVSVLVQIELDWDTINLRWNLTLAQFLPKSDILDIKTGRNKPELTKKYQKFIAKYKKKLYIWRNRMKEVYLWCNRMWILLFHLLKSWSINNTRRWYNILRNHDKLISYSKSFKIILTKLNHFCIIYPSYILHSSATMSDGANPRHFKMRFTEIRSEKVPDLSQLVPIWTQFRPNLISLAHHIW